MNNFIEHKKDSYCSYCGAPFPETAVCSGTYPRICGVGSPSGCGKTTYNTPHVVAVVIVPIRGAQGTEGVLLVRRRQGATKGQLALPGGYVDGSPSESVRPHHCLQGQGALEVLEETGVKVSPSSLRHVCSVGATESNTILVFFEAPPVEESSMPPFEPNDEVFERVVAYEYRELCFSTHSEILRWFFSGKPDSLWEFSPIFASYRN